MRAVRLIWKTRVTRKQRAAILEWIRKHYPAAKDRGGFVELRAGQDDTKFVWIFMFSKTFKDLE